MKELLNIINEEDQIIGTETREIIHRDGLLHREIHVYFITPNKEVIFQHRALDKDTFPNLLDATVGGHVEIGQSYEETAIKETAEETGVIVNSSDLILINKIKKEGRDSATGKINNVFNCRYAYIYRGDIKNLKIEIGKAIGFELWPLDKLLKANPDDQNRFIPYIFEFATTELIEFINNLEK